MSIDWITVAAQILNFLVLLWLLKRYLYRPILDGIDAREREIADRLSQASDARTAAETADVDFRARAARLEGERDSVLEAGRDAAETERQTLLAQSREQLAHEHAAHEMARADELQRYTAELQRSGAHALLALMRWRRARTRVRCRTRPRVWSCSPTSALQSRRSHARTCQESTRSRTRWLPGAARTRQVR